MELLRHEQLRTLIEPAEEPCVSIFLPTHRLGAEVRQGAIRLKNQIRQVEEQLQAQKLRTAEIREFLAPIQKLCENSGFWQYQSDGLAIFRSRDHFYYYRLPMHVDDLLVVTDRFHVKPLLRLFTEDGRYYLLSLSKNEIRFLECTRYGARIVDLPPATPRSLEQVLELAGVEKQRRGHAGLAHGHGGGSEDDKQDLRQFFRMVDKGVHEVLRDDHAPLVLAGVEYLFPLYREVNTYGHLMEHGITGNPDGRRAEDLQSNAWAVVEPHFRKARADAAQRFEHHASSARSSQDVREVVPAACQGRVDQLFVAVGRQIWGRCDQETHTVTIHDEKAPGDRDLLNFTAIQALLQGGAVYAVAPGEVPGGGLVAAVFRY